MKKNILSLISAVFLAANAYAQIPNNGFENWTAVGSYNDPNSWGTLNSTTSFSGVYTCTKGTPGNPGASYIKLISKTVTGLGVVPGIAGSGTLNLITKTASGFPYATRSQNLTGSWQYMASGSDQGFISVVLSKWNAGMGMRDTIAYANQKLSGMAMSWANFNIALNYMSGANPDTATIILSASGTTPVANSYLYVDNLAFSGTVTGIENNSINSSAFSFLPNPAKENILIKLSTNNSNAVKIQLLDVSGKMVKEHTVNQPQANNECMIDISTLARGIYFLKVSNGVFTETKKVVVE